MIKRLRNKFVLINMTIVTVMLAVIFCLIVFFMGMNMEIETRQMMQQLTEDAVRPGMREEFPGGRRNPLWRPNLLVQINSRGDQTVINNGLFEQVDAELVEAYVEEVLTRGKAEGFLRAEKLRFQKRTTPFGESILFLDISREVATISSLVKTCIIICIVSFFLFLGISFLLAKWAVGPVEKAWNQQRQFVADASHELKTPLTVIMTNAELLQSPDYGESEHRRFALSILTMSHQMRGLVESLLELARVDNGTAKMTFSKLDFSELVSDCLLPFEPVYFEKELQLESSIEEGLQTKGSPAHLRQVVEILLDNASKYSSPGGTVVVTVKRQGSHCLLSVANPGDPISREDLQNIFKRFYRIDKARAMNHSYGLGLAIADSIITGHGGKIWAESGNGVNTFHIQLTVV